ncbi:SIMPL domain-containing protein [Candidatus Wolfebacteria bacterium]|nr:SIMPL domain-containing protein [Candidatus Wolfebacteria bacterium]
MQNDNVKLKNIAIVGFLIFLGLVILYSAFWGPAKKFGDSFSSARTVTVSASGKVTAEPDLARVNFAVVTEGADPESVVEKNNQKANAAINFVKTKGIAKEDIETVQYQLSPRYEYDESARKSFLNGYTLNQRISLKIHDLKNNLKKLTEILAGLAPLGVNEIGSISFEVEEPEKYLSEARNQALARAGEKAEAMAKALGVRLGRIISWSEYGGRPPIPYYEGGLGGGGSIIQRATAPSIEPGTQEVITEVSVTYEIR